MHYPSRRKPLGRRILVVDDDQDNLALVSRILAAEEYLVETASNGALALEKIEVWYPDLVLLDVNMPGLSGLETLHKLRDRREYVAVILVSANNDNEDVIRGLDAGADDYVGKPYDPRVLLARTRAQLRIKDLNDELAQANRKLQNLVDIDDLTGLYNMRSIYQRLEKALHDGQQQLSAVCVIMMDMDHFKRVNDDHDHLFGSFVLSRVGELIKKHIRKSDFAARYGGDEFLVALTNVNLETASTIAERLRETIAKTTFINGPDAIDLTVSLGYAITQPGDTRLDAKTLVRIADRALYEAKEQGRNRVCHYDLNVVSLERFAQTASLAPAPTRG